MGLRKIHCPVDYLSGLLDRYFQYRVSLETDDPGSTPTLNDVTLNWDPLGIEFEPEVTEYLFTPWGNTESFFSSCSEVQFARNCFSRAFHFRPFRSTRQ